jgi:hypothetical protein
MDTTLEVDDLCDFLTKRTVADDPMLAVDGLEDLFPERESDDLETFVRRLETVASEALRPPPAEPDDDLDDDEPDEALRLEIRRTAVEFQHFAEQFHAFASELRALRGSSTEV